MAVWILVGMAIAAALISVRYWPAAARSLLGSWRTYKEAIFITVGAFTTYYALTSGVWYLMLLGSLGIVAAVWAIVLTDPFKPLLRVIR